MVRKENVVDDKERACRKVHYSFNLSVNFDFLPCEPLDLTVFYYNTYNTTNLVCEPISADRGVDGLGTEQCRE